jgi:hypothetical protein
MKLNLSSQIVLNKVPVEYYQPKTVVDRSEITRCEKIPTDIFATIDEGARNIADNIETEIKAPASAKDASACWAWERVSRSRRSIRSLSAATRQAS